MERQFKNRTPKQRRGYVTRVPSISRVVSSARRYRQSLGGVMIVPPTPGTENLISKNIQQVRANMVKEIGQEAYDERIMKSNQEFEKITGLKVHS